MWLAFALIPTRANTENNTTRQNVRKFKDCMYNFFKNGGEVKIYS